MVQAIPRALVAKALGVDASALPPGDLPVDRLATRFLAYLRAGDEDTLPPPDHPDGWTFALFEALVHDHPELALAATLTTLAACESPEDVAAIAAGPLEALLVAHGAALIDALEARAAEAPRLAYALTGVWPPEDGANPLLWARVEAARRDLPGLDDGAPMPGAAGLV